MTTKQLVYTALMTAIIAILGLVPVIPLPFSSVPIVLQNIGIFLAGVILGRKYGTLSVIVFLLLVVAGLPLLSGGRGGIGVFAGPSAGFLLLYPVVAFMIGAIRDRFINEINFWILFVGILVFGVIALDVIGTLIMGMIMGMIINIPFTKAISISLAYLPGDILKAIVASLIGTALLNHSQFRQIMGLK
ncbi:TPA: biotin transporter BioY [Staphylococcus aureus]|nr:biotin transporter BioY [Staphylococcus aureus]